MSHCLVGFTFSIMVGIFGAVLIIIWPATPIQLPKLMFALNECEAPCLFGQNLQNKTQDQIITILRNSWAVDQITTDGQTTSWKWNETIWRAINRTPALTQYNVIKFDSDHLRSLEVHFSFPLEDLLAVFGKPKFVYPFTYQSFEMDYNLIFQNISGRFSALTNCNHPTLLPKTPIVYYMYDPKFNSPKSDIPYIVWQGYTDNLPDCTVFVP